MWLLKLKNGLEISEAQARFWDNVPPHVEIEAMAFAIKRNNAPPYVLDMRGYEEYCIERMDISNSVEDQVIGYCLLGVKDSQVFKIEIHSAGMKFKSYSRSESTIPDRCWRKGI